MASLSDRNSFTSLTQSILNQFSYIYHPDQSVNTGHFFSPHASLSTSGSRQGLLLEDFGRPHSLLRSLVPPPPHVTLQGVQSDHGPSTKLDFTLRFFDRCNLIISALPGHFLSLHFSSSVSLPGQYRRSDVDPSGRVHFLVRSLLPPPQVTLHSPQDDQVDHAGHAFVLQTLMVQKYFLLIE